MIGGGRNGTMRGAYCGLRATCYTRLDACQRRFTVTHMEKIQVYLEKEELGALREAAERSGRSVAAAVREAIRKSVLKPRPSGPVAIWDGEPKRTAVDHDSVHDDP